MFQLKEWYRYINMALLKVPLRKAISNDIARPWLGVTITNPHTGKRIKVWGIIDTGADECALPAAYAEYLGHNLQAGATKEINTGNGITIAYSHTVRIET
jgi:predicted aspartyl protease